MGLFGNKKNKKAFGDKKHSEPTSNLVVTEEPVVEESAPPVSSFYATDGDDLPGNDTMGAELENTGDKNQNIEPVLEEVTPPEPEPVLEEVKPEEMMSAPMDTPVNNDFNYDTEETPVDYTPDMNYTPDSYEPSGDFNQNNMGEENMNNMPYNVNDPYNAGNQQYGTDMPYTDNNYDQSTGYAPDMQQNAQYGQDIQYNETPQYGENMQYEAQQYGEAPQYNENMQPVQDMNYNPDMYVAPNQGDANMYGDQSSYDMNAGYDTSQPYDMGAEQPVPQQNNFGDYGVPEQQMTVADPFNMYGNNEVNVNGYDPNATNPDVQYNPESYNPDMNNGFNTPDNTPIQGMENNYDSIVEETTTPQYDGYNDTPMMEVIEKSDPAVTPETDDGRVTINTISECRDENIWSVLKAVYDNHPADINSFICANAVCSDPAGNTSNRIVYSYLFGNDADLVKIQDILKETEAAFPKGIAIYLDSEIVNNEIIPMLQAA